MSGRGRAMIYPYTLTSKIVQFPYKHYFTKNWVFKYYALGVLVSAPVFISISKLANSPANLAKYEETKKKEAAEHH